MNEKAACYALLNSRTFRKAVRFPALVLAAVFLFAGCGIRNDNTGAVFPEPVKYIFRDIPSDKTISSKSKGLRFSVDKAVFNEQSSSRAMETVEKDIGEIERVFGPLRPVSISLNGSSAGECRTLGNRVFCSFRDITNGSYRVPLTEACLGLKEPWASYGAAAYVFGERPDESELAEYYKAAPDTDVLTLFAAYFCPEFAGEEISNTARDTAASLSFFIIDRYGAEAFKKGATPAQKREWLSAIGADRAFTDPFEGLFQGYAYGSTKDYPLVVTAKGVSFYFKKIQSVTETPEQIRRLLIETAREIEGVDEYLKVNAPRNYKDLKRNLYRQVSFYFVSGIHGGKMNGSTDTEQRRIYIADPAAIIHEYVHIAVPRNAEKGDIVWQYEGLAEYLSLEVCPADSVKEKYYHVLFDDVSQGNEAVKLIKLIREYYLERASFPKEPRETDAALFMEAAAVSTLQNPDLRTDSPLLSWTVLGNELTYPQAYLFVSYLIDRYSLDTVLDYCHEGADFEKVFGDSYENIKEEWIASLNDG